MLILIWSYVIAITFILIIPIYEINYQAEVLILFHKNKKMSSNQEFLFKSILYMKYMKNIKEVFWKIIE